MFLKWEVNYFYGFLLSQPRSYVRMLQL
jgi:hypothetical protein